MPEAKLRELEAIGAKRVIAALATLSLPGRSRSADDGAGRTVALDENR
jgi:hypothetical protein